MALRFKLDENIPGEAAASLRAAGHDVRTVWVLRPATHGIAPVLRMLQQALALAATEQSAKRLWVIEPGRVRIRD